MVGVWTSTLISVIIISLISLTGVFFLYIKASKLSRILLILVSFAVGALFGDVFIHLLPEMVEEGGFTLTASFSILAGILVFFIIEKFVSWRHCHYTSTHHHRVHPLATMSLVGDGLHNLIDGMLIAGSYIVSFPLGVATTLAVLFHEIPQEIGDFAILLHAGMKKTKALMFNFLSALLAVVGAVVILLLSNASQQLSFLIPFTAGGFIYIAGADLLPELHKCQFSAKSSVIQLIAMVLGILAMYLLTFL